MTRRIALAVGVVAIAFAVARAMQLAWLCDDAFISFRYADHLARGLGLVYNAGERVEGYTNFLWTVGLALGIRLGVAPEAWSVAWGVAAYAGTLALLLADALARNSPRHVATPAAMAGRPAPAAAVPLACVLIALHPDAQRYATGGLETAAFGCLVTAGTLLVSRRAWGPRALVGAGLAFALAALVRPDGALFVPLVALAAAISWPRGARAAAVLAGVFLLVWAPVVVAKAAWYGDWLPNTYYAKSAHLAWWSQGWTYTSLYFRRYVVLALALPVALAAWAVRGRDASRAERDVDLLLPLVLALAYTAYVARVGGDFMYARLLVPIAPLVALTLARGVERLAGPRPALVWSIAVACAAGIAFTRSPIPAGEVVNGIADEPTVYTREMMARTRAEGLGLRRYFDGVPVTIAIVGSQAALAWYANPAVVIEAGAGLTDRRTAHQPLPSRGRVGHEKQASVAYLLERRVDLTLHHVGSGTLDLDAVLPPTVINLDSVPGRIVHWNPPVLAELRARGARFFDLPASLDLYCSALGQLSDEQVRAAYAQLRAFYFAFVPDSVHERAFRERLARTGPERGKAP